MKLHLVIFILALFTISNAVSQNPMPVKSPQGSNLRLSCNGNQEAGSVRIGNYVGLAQSSDIDLDKMYLCAYDRVPIVHNGDQFLNGDPRTNTPAGVGYAFYNCRPSIGGEDLTTVSTDGCLVPNPDPSLAFYVASDNDPNYNLLLNNDGSLINNFNGGNPGSWFFAPITYDFLDVSSGRNIAVYEDSPSNPGVEGPCVDVSTDEAFEVVYLTPFNISNFSSTSVGGVCSGEFIVTGGLPEYEAQAIYDITIYSKVNDAQVATLSRNDYSHGELVEFTVPISGDYYVEIRDGKNCIETFDITMDCGNMGTISFPMETRMPGETFCVNIVVDNLLKTTGITFSIKFDPNILTLNSATWLVDRDRSFSNINTINANQGVIGVIWGTDDFANGTDFASPTDFIELCFTVSLDAEQGDMSPLNFDNDPIEIESYDKDFNDLGIRTNNGKVNINETTDLTFSTNFCVSENGQDNGSFTINIQNGTPPYDLTYSGPVSGTSSISSDNEDVTFEDLFPGLYIITVTDANGETAVRQINITMGNQPSFDMDVINPSCNGRKDGSIQLDNIVAEGNYSIEWSNQIYNTTEITDLGPGRYGVIVIDENGCEAEDFSMLNYIEIRALKDIQDVSCVGGDDGMAEITGFGGQPSSAGEYTYEWSTGQLDMNVVSSTVTNLSEGIYFVTITDSKGCIGIDSVNIEADNDINFSNLTIEDLLCAGDSDGQFSGDIITDASSPNLRIDILGRNTSTNQNQFGNTFDFQLLPADTFDISVVDLNNPGCTLDTVIVINEPDTLKLELVTLRDINCDGINNGYIEVRAEGGTLAPGSQYTFTWSDAGSTSEINNNLGIGNYSVTVTDDNSCSATLDNLIILEPAKPEILLIDSTSITCSGECDGVLTSILSPGSYPIRDTIWTINSTTTLNIGTLRNACSGFYSLEIVDEGNCRDTVFFQLSEPLPIDTSMVSITHPTCHDSENGSINIIPTGGTPPYRFRWSDNSIGNTGNPTGLNSGIYSVSITDIEDCPPLELVIELSAPDPLNVSFTNVSGVDCYGDCTGSAIANATGGVTNPNYSFEWNNGILGNSNNTLCRGENYVYVSDGTCSDTFFIDIPGPDSLYVSIIDSIVPTCNGYTDGSIRVQGMGGSPSYLYDWENGMAGNERLNIPAGSYQVTVTDDNGCTVERIIDLGEPDTMDIVIDIDETMNETCYDTEDGIIKVNASGGNGSYQYNWNPNVSSSDLATGLGNGYYFITVTDIRGCTDTVSHLLTAPEEIQFDVNEVGQIICFGDNSQIEFSNFSGGSGTGYMGFVNDRKIDISNPIEISAGTYNIRVEDGNGCGKDSMITISSPGQFAINLQPEYLLSLGDSILLEPRLINQRFPIDSVIWFPGDFFSCDTCLNTYVNPREDSEITILIKDENGCLAEATTLIKIDNSRHVYIPNAFTPNGDGQNDYFQVFTGSDVQEIKYLKIFDRWGNMMYHDTDILPLANGSRGWDGFFRGRPAGLGVYTYAVSVEFKDGETVNYTGSLTIVATIGDE